MVYQACKSHRIHRAHETYRVFYNIFQILHNWCKEKNNALHLNTLQ